MLLFKLVVLVAGVLIDWQAYRVWQIARQLRLVRVAGNKYPLALQKKKIWAAARLGVFSIAAYGVIDQWVKVNPHAFRINEGFLLSHIIIAFLYITGIGAMICYTGKKFPRMHAIIGFSVFALLAILNLSGGYMLWVLPNHAPV